MEALTISEGFLKSIGSKKVIHAFFSTYCFEPDFFELEVIPLLLGNPALSSYEELRYLQIQKLMHTTELSLSVAYDFDVFNPRLPSRIESIYLPIRVDGACQHAKISVLALQNQDKDGNKDVSIVVAAGSYNLTKAGWWENIEVGHWVELTKEYAPANIRNPLIGALGYFDKENPTLIALIKALENLVETPDDPNCVFYFSKSKKIKPETIKFPDFIEKNTKEILEKYNHLEIISPFFAQNIEGDSEETKSHIGVFFKKFKSISVLLPLDSKKETTILEPVYNDLKRFKVKWSNWRLDLNQSHDVPSKEKIYRKLHAKIYNHKGTKASDNWLFLGSVNFSYKAFFCNIEAGFLLKGIKAHSLFLETSDNTTPVFATNIESEAIALVDAVAMPVVQLLYDWKTQQLHITSSKAGQITICDSSANKLCEVMVEDKVLAENLPEIEAQLQRSSLIKVTWQNHDQKQATRYILISQRNIYKRPIDNFTAISLLELLNIFQAMGSEKYHELIAEQLNNICNLQSNGLDDEFLPSIENGKGAQTFFSEFSQVNGAFWSLAKQLEKFDKAKNQKQLDYYLLGRQPDSLWGLLQALKQPNSKHASEFNIVHYLSLLSLSELLEKYQPYTTDSLQDEVEAEITKLEKIAPIPNSKKFLAWIRRKFSQPINDIFQVDDRDEPTNETN